MNNSVVRFAQGGSMCMLAPGIPLSHPVTPGTLSMCMRDAEFREGVRNLAFGHPMLVMPVPHSPMMLYLMHTTKDPFQPSVVDSLQMISLLYMVYTCYSFSEDLTYYKKNKARIDLATRTCNDNLLRHREQVDKATCVEEFAMEAYRYTVQLINELETCLHHMFDLEIPLAMMLTPRVDPGVLQFPNQLALTEIQEHVFAVHTSIGRIATEDPTRIWFFPLDVPAKHTMLPFISDQRLREYFAFWEIGDKK